MTTLDTFRYLPLLAVLVFPACGGSSSDTTQKTKDCEINSDCSSSELCAEGLCRVICREDRDCGAGETCEETQQGTACTVPGGDGDGDGDGDGTGDGTGGTSGDGDGDGDGDTGTGGNAPSDCEPGIFGTSIFGDACYGK